MGGSQLGFFRIDANFLRLSETVQLFPDVHPYVDLEPLFYTLVRPIPQILWADKPFGPGYDLAELLGSKGVSLTHSIVGELYAMHGLFAVFIGGLILGLLANMWNRILAVPGELGKSMVYGLGAMVLFAALRSMQDLVIMSYGLIGWLVIARMLPGAKSRTATDSSDSITSRIGP